MSTTISAADLSFVDFEELSRFAFGICHNFNLAEDAAQSAIANILQKVRKEGEFCVDSIDAFLKTSARNALTDILRVEKRRRIEHSDNAVEALENAATTSPDGNIDVFEAVASIPFTHQEKTLINHLTYGLTTSDICSMMEISKENFWKISQRIRDKVRDSIE